MWLNLRHRIGKWHRIGITATGVAGVVVLLRLTGGLQLLELMALDQLFRTRPIEPADPRIVIVTIDESDINTLGNWPMSDAVLVRLLQQIQQQRPRVIGLDIFRNLPVEPGHQDLLALFASTPNLIGIEKVLGGSDKQPIDAPPVLKERGQVSASDLVLDVDGRIHRSLLYLREEDKPVLGLGAKLAFEYLAEEGITPQTLNANQGRFRLGKAVFSPLKPNTGGYVNVDNGGYQILANFRRMAQGFQSVSMTDVLSGEIPANVMRDRIVIIGLTAESLEDRFYTPFSIDSGTAQAGVEIHAQVVSQLLSAALNGRPLLKSWSEPVEWLWILLWSSIGAVLGWVSPTPQRTVFNLLGLSLGLLGGAYILFWLGWWLVVVPPLFGLIGSAIVSNGWLLWSQLKQSNQQLANYAETLEERIHERTVELEQEKELLQAIVNHIPVMMTLYDPQGRVYFVNQEFEKVLGWSNAEISTVDLVQECFPDPQIRQQGLNHMTTTTGKWRDFTLRNRDGDEVDTSWANVQLSNGVRIGIGQDIRERLAAIQRERKQAEETSVLDERNRMAREIHDTLAQTLTGILIHLETVSEEMPADSDVAQEHVAIARELAHTGLTEARRSVAALRPQLLENRDLSSALEHLINQMQRPADTHVHYQLKGASYPLPPEVENHLLRIGQEGLTNAIKYADAHEIYVELVYEPTQCVLRVSDDGQGFDVGAIPIGSGFGLLGMSERAKQIGGDLSIQSQPGQGTRVIVIINRELADE